MAALVVAHNVFGVVAFLLLPLVCATVQPRRRLLDAYVLGGLLGGVAVAGAGPLLIGDSSDPSAVFAYAGLCLFGGATGAWFGVTTVAMVDGPRSLRWRLGWGLACGTVLSATMALVLNVEGWLASAYAMPLGVACGLLYAHEADAAAVHGPMAEAGLRRRWWVGAAVAVVLLVGPPAALAVRAAADAALTSDPGYRRSAVQQARSEPTLRLLRDGDPRQRASAASALGEAFLVADDRVVAALGKACRDRDAGVRRAAATALGRLGAGSAMRRDMGQAAAPGGQVANIVRPLARAARDRDAAVRLAAIQALGQTREAAAIEPLGELLGRPEASDRYAALSALLGIPDAAISPYVRQAATDSDPRVRDLALSVMRQPRPPGPARAPSAAPAPPRPAPPAR